MTIKSAVGISRCKHLMKQRYRHVYGTAETEPIARVNAVAGKVLSIIACTDAPYHDLSHTVSVITVGQQILEGKQVLEGTVNRQDWVNVTLALMFHDVGYIKGACRQDQPEHHYYTTGNNQLLRLAPPTTDASLAPYHIERSQMVAQEMLAGYAGIDLDLVKAAIESTRFPATAYPACLDYGGYLELVRAADLIGQLADPHYLERLPALFDELAETGHAAELGYSHPADMRAAYPDFFRNRVLPHIQQALLYLSVIPQGQQTVRRLWANLHRSHCPESAVGISDFCPIFIDDYGQVN